MLISFIDMDNIMHWLKTFGLSLTWLLRTFLFVTGIMFLLTGDPIGFSIYIFTFILSLLPIMVGQLYKVKFHWLLQFMIALMISIHMFGFLGAYLWIPFYDDIAHILGSVMLTFIGFSIVYSLNYCRKIKISLPMMGVFSFLWTMAIGAVWEIIEFIWDNISVLSYEYGFSQNSLFDTMSDLSLDAAAGILIALFCVFIVRKVDNKKLKAFFEPLAKMVKK